MSPQPRAAEPEPSQEPTWAGKVEPTDPPRYCPRCNSPSEGAGPLCGACGERVRPQAYCPTCERFWTRPVGTDCPKHDVPMGDPPPARPVGISAPWATVGRFSDAQKAEAPRIRLEAEGIPTFVEGERMGSHSMYHVATGGVKLQVPQPLLADARVLLAQNWSPPETVDDLDDAWDDLAPEPGAGRRSVMRGAVLVMLFGPLLLALVARLIGL